jgi:hypothetical protein
MDGETRELPWVGFEEDERLEGEDWSGAVHWGAGSACGVDEKSDMRGSMV